MVDTAEARAAATHDAGYLAVMAIRDFRLLWTGSLLYLIASAMSQVAIPILVYDLTESASIMSVILIVQLVPRAFLSPFAGVLADTFDRRRLMLGSCAVQVFGAAALPFSTSEWQIAAITAISGFGAVVYNPSEMAAVPTIVRSSQLVTALSAVQVASALTRVVGPAIGAGIIALSGTDLAFWTQALLYVGAILILSRMRLAPMRPLEAAAGVGGFLRYLWAEAVQGLRVVWRVPIVRAVCGTEALWSLALATLSVTTVVYVNETLDLGDQSDLIFGLLAVSISFGAVLGALVARRIEQRGGRLMLMLVGYFAPLLFVPALLTPPLPVLFVCWFLLGFADAWLVIAMFAYVIESVPDEMRGRVFAIWGGIISIASMGAYALIGWLTETIGPEKTYAFVGLTVALGSPLLLWLSGALASVRRQPAPPAIAAPSLADR
jgi:MFS family permease